MRFFTKQEGKRFTTSSQSRGEPAQILPAGATAPDFTLKDAEGEIVSKADFLESPLVIAFYPADWSPVCGDQLTLYNEVLPLFREYDARLVAISVDSRWSHQAYAADRNLEFTLLSDFEPKGEVAKRYGVYNQESGQAERALFVIDGNGVIQWSHLSPSNVNPGADGILAALEKINN